MAWALVADAAVDLAVGVGYGAVAWRLGGRDPPEAERASAAAMATWWWGLSATGFLAAALSLLALAPRPSVALFGALSFLTVFAFTVGMAGLALHLARTFLGPKTPLLVVLLGIYGLYAAIEGWILIANVPSGIVLQGWRPVLETPPPPAWLLAASFALALVPPLAGAGAYALGAGSAARAMGRSRALRVAASLVLWLASVVVIAEPAVADAFVWQAASRACILVSAGAIHFAYDGSVSASASTSASGS